MKTFMLTFKRFDETDDLIIFRTIQVNGSKIKNDKEISTEESIKQIPYWKFTMAISTN